jgi:hypothetical protein
MVRSGGQAGDLIAGGGFTNLSWQASFYYLFTALANFGGRQAFNLINNRLGTCKNLKCNY